MRNIISALALGERWVLQLEHKETRLHVHTYSYCDSPACSWVYIPTEQVAYMQFTMPSPPPRRRGSARLLSHLYACACLPKLIVRRHGAYSARVRATYIAGNELLMSKQKGVSMETKERVWIRHCMCLIAVEVHSDCTITS